MKFNSFLVILCFVFFTLTGFATTSSTNADTTIYVVRHTEATDEKEPTLKATGIQRAKDLARVLRSAKLDACFATEFKRTQMTAQPSADQANLNVRDYQAGKEADLAVNLKTLAKNNQGTDGYRVLVVGHSNTVPKILQLFGEQNPPKLTHFDHDNLFVIQISDKGETSITNLHFGQPNPTKPK